MTIAWHSLVRSSLSSLSDPSSCVLCCTVQLQCTSLFLCNIDTQHQSAQCPYYQGDGSDMWCKSHVVMFFFFVFFFLRIFFLFCFFASQEYISFRDFLLFCFCVLVFKKKKQTKKNKGVCEHFPLLLAPERWHHVSCSVLRLSRC